MSRRYFQIANWERLQHYKGPKAQTPAWIKLYRELLSDYEFNQLPELEQGRLIKLWLLAAATHNRIPDDREWVADRIGAADIDLQLLLEHGFLEPHPDSRPQPVTALERFCDTGLEPAEQRREEQRRADAREPGIDKLLAALTDKDDKTADTISRMCVRYRLTEGDLAWAHECATGPGVESPTRVAVAELKKRGQGRAA